MIQMAGFFFFFLTYSRYDTIYSPALYCMMLQSSETQKIPPIVMYTLIICVKRVFRQINKALGVVFEKKYM